jgi:hypothetical protein
MLSPFFEPLEDRSLFSGTASISGAVFTDLNSNGHRDSGEKGIANVTVYLDANNNKKLDASEKKTTTDSSGNFSFTKLSAGAYIVRQVLPSGFSQTTPANNFGIHVSLKSGQAVKNQLIGDVASTAPAQPFWSTFGGNAQHTADSSVAAQNITKLKWHVTIDQAPNLDGDEILAHYGSPVSTKKNTVIVPVKTTTSGGFQLRAYHGSDGTLLWVQSTDYVLPPSSWTPEFQPAIAPDGRLYYPGPGGTIYWRDNLDSASGHTGQLAFYGLANYTANKSALNSTVFIDTPLTIDKNGNIFFGFQVTGSNPLNLKGGIARIDANGNGTFVTAAAAAGDSGVDKVAQNSAPAISNDGKFVYVSVNLTTGVFAAINHKNYLLALDSTTLATIDKVSLVDPTDSTTAANVVDISTASPMVAPGGDVYYGVLDNGNENHDRGYLLHFSSDLKTQKITGSFGWDDTPSVVPASMVPSYHGSSSYLIMTKYNDYAGQGGTGFNKVAILDPNATQTDPTTGIKVMKEIETIEGVTPDSEFPDIPGAVREWCINSAAVDPATDSVLVNSEDGKLYRWNLGTNTFSQKIAMSGGVGEAYTSTSIGPDGTIYATNKGILWAIGS